MKRKVNVGLPDSGVPSEWAVEADNILYTVHWACLPDGSCAPGGIREQTRVTLENSSAGRRRPRAPAWTTWSRSRSI